MRKRPNRKKSGPGAAVNIIAAAILISFVAVAGKASCVVVDKIVAVVNGEVITQREITWLLMPVFEQYKGEYTGKHLETKMVEAEDMALNQLIEDKLILSEAKRQGIEVTDKEIEERLQSVKNGFKSEGEFRDALAEQNLTLSELKKKFKDEILKSKIVRKEVGWKAVIMPNEVRNYYDGHREEFLTPEKVRAYHILVKKENDKRGKEEARFLIERIKGLIVEEGKDFKELAKEYSEGPNAEKGGDLGLVKKGEMMKEIDDVIFSLEPGEVSGIVETHLGHHIFMVAEKIPAEVIEFETAESEIENMIYKKRIEKSLQNWLKELRKSAYISIK